MHLSILLWSCPLKVNNILCVFKSIHSVAGESIRSSIVISIPSVICAGLYHVSLP